MRELPMIFNTEMVKAIIAGKKTQTRRPVKFRGISEDLQSLHVTAFNLTEVTTELKSPFGKVGDVLYVRETFHCEYEKSYEYDEYNEEVFYLADMPNELYEKDSFKWSPSIHMPKELSRIKLKVKRVWIERVQDISPANVDAEGVSIPLVAGFDVDINDCLWPSGERKVIGAYKELWDSIYGTWEQNPYVWCCEFERMAD